MDAEDAKERIIASVFDLIETEPTSKGALLDWQRKAGMVKLLMELDTGDLQVPHVLWHYLEDADVRMKDPRYAESQTLHVNEALRRWEN